MGASYPSSFLFLIGYFRHMKMIQQFTKIIFIYTFISLSDVIDPHQSLFTLIYPNLSFLPLHMLIYPWLSLYMLIYAYLSLSTFIYPFISLSTLIYTYLSLSYFIYPWLFLSISIFPYLPIFIPYIYLVNKSIHPISEGSSLAGLISKYRLHFLFFICRGEGVIDMQCM